LADHQVGQPFLAKQLEEGIAAHRVHDHGANLWRARAFGARALDAALGQLGAAKFPKSVISNILRQGEFQEPGLKFPDMNSNNPTDEERPDVENRRTDDVS